MNRTIASACAAAILFAGCGEAQARASEAGSEFVQCDGAPAHMSTGATVGLLTLMVATGGVVGAMIGSPEGADVTKRLKGAEGVTACTAALARETDEIRRRQLILARAVHHLEAKDYATALAEARSTPAPPEGAVIDKTRPLGLALGALEIQAVALAGLGRAADAEQAAMRMAAASPYDLVNTLRASRYLALTPEMTVEKRAFIEQAARLWPRAAEESAAAREWAGDYAGSAIDHEAFLEVVRGFLKPDEALNIPHIMANAAVAHMMAGDGARAQTAAAEARTTIDRMRRDGAALRFVETVARAEELLDFHAIGRALAEGRTDEARMLFAGRSRWTAPTAAAVSDLSRKLRAGATPAQLVGGLARDPAAIHADALASRLAMVIDEKSVMALYNMPVIPGWAFDAVARPAWRVDKSRFLIKRRPKDTYVGDLYMAFGFDPNAAAQALLLHAALTARSQGKQGFVLIPAREKLEWVVLRTGDPGQPGFPRATTFSSAKVIADLSPLMPEPVKRK